MFSKKKFFYFSQFVIYIQKIHHFKQDSDYMVPTGISQTSLPNEKYIFKKGNNQFKGTSL